MSLRTRLTLLTGLTLTSGLAVLCLAANVLLAHTIDSDIQARLTSRLNAIASSISVTAGRLDLNDTLTDAALDIYTWIYDAHGRTLEAASASPATSRLADELARRSAAAPIARAGITMDAPGGNLIASRPVLSNRRRLGTIVTEYSAATLDSLRERVLYGSIAVAALTLLVGVLAVRRALTASLSAVDQMTRDAADWESHDLDRRFDLGPARDEITALAETLDHLLARIAASRRHEQRFAAEVAHELRTPLAAIRGVAELARGSDDVEEAREALARIEDQSQRISATLDTLIAFARRDSEPAVNGVDLVAVARSFPDVTVVGSDGPRVEGDPDLIRQILAPLVENAQRYAASSVRIELSSRAGMAVATVRDDGPGVASELGPRVFLPGVRDPTHSPDGAGLGLPLAQRLAHSCGGEIELGAGPGGCFTVLLPAFGPTVTDAGATR